MNTPVWAALIPAYNAASLITEVIQGVCRYLLPDQILVVDDGSTDNTGEVAREAGAQVLTRKSNGGKGRALRDGFAKILGWNVSWVVCLDADGQHDPNLIPEFQAAADKGRFDLIAGNRLGNMSEMPLSRRISNRLSSALVSLRTGSKIADVQCGYRAVSTELLRRMKLKTESYDIEVEMVLEAWRLGGKIGWVEVPAIYREEPSYLIKFPETLRFLKILGRSFYEQHKQ